MKIISCEVGPTPIWRVDPLPNVTVEFEDGTKKKLFDFFPDELSFQPEEFIGLTEAEALDLYRKKDLAYIQS